MEEPNTRWTLGTGSLDAALRRVADAGGGALLTINVGHSSLVSLRSDGAERDDEGKRLLHAWQTIVTLLPADTVGLRDGWDRFSFVVKASEESCIELGKQIITSLLEQTSWRWHVLLIRAFKDEPERTLICDPGYELRTVQGKSALAWIEPYAGQDWRESQRYPAVRFISY